jgi:NAD(P)-dependent dehydrogenase (short-subunit alcohol dehydrogenase family)
LEKQINGKVILITGGTRGIGRSIANMAAQKGASVVITYRDPAKAGRAARVKRVLEGHGTPLIIEQADITSTNDRLRLLAQTKEQFGKIDGLVLNAAGGLEQGKEPGYAMLINRDANLGLIQEAQDQGLLQPGAWVIYITSTWAHEYGQKDPPNFYLPVASTKRAAEDAMRDKISEWQQLDISLGVVVAPLVTDTGAFAIIKHRFKDTLQQEAKEGDVVSPEAVSEATLSYLIDRSLPSGHTIYL